MATAFCGVIRVLNTMENRDQSLATSEQIELLSRSRQEIQAAPLKRFQFPLGKDWEHFALLTIFLKKGVDFVPLGMGL